MNITGERVIQWSGLAAIIAGILYILTQLIHPSHEPASITSSAWELAHYFTLGFGLFGILGISGIYARQVKEAGWLGFIGFIMFYLALILVVAFGFMEAVIVPELVDEAPQYIADVYSIFDGGAGPGALGPIYSLNGIFYLLGGIIFGVATVRANVFPRMAAIVFVIGAVGSLAGAISEPAGRVSTLALSFGLIWLGYTLLTEKSQ